MVQLEYGSKKYLFMGDASTSVETKLISNNMLEKVDLLKVAHHGSNTSTGKEFLDTIKPTYAVISSGSSYSKFPNNVLLELLYTYVDKENVYITENKGTIWVSSDGNEITIKTLKYNLDGANSQIIGFLNNIESIFKCSLFNFGKQNDIFHHLVIEENKSLLC